MATKSKPLTRKGVFLPSPETRHMTIDEIIEWLGDPAEEGQAARFGQGAEVISKLWTPEALAEEIHNTSQAAMLAEVNIEACEDENGKPHREDGNRTIVALKILKARFGDGPVEVQTEGDLEGRTVRYKHEKNYGVKFPVKFYGKLTADQRSELRLKRQRARKDLSLADYYHAACELLAGFPGDMPEKLFVKRIGAETIRRYYEDALEGPDENGDFKIKNRQGPIQDPKRLMKLPKFVRERFLAGLAGIGPKVPAKKLTTLLQNWEQDVEASGDKLTTEMDEDEITALLPESELVNTMEQIAKAKRGGKTSAGVMSAKELDGFAKVTKGSRIVNTTVKFVSRAKGFVGEPIYRALMDAAVAAEKALGADHPVWSGLDKALAEAKAAPAEAAAPEASDEDE